MPTPEVHVTTQSPSTLLVTGALVFASVSDALNQADSLLKQSPHATLDLRNVTKVDSAGLACVLAILATGRRLHSKLKIVSVPEDLAALAKVCQVDSLLV